MSNSDRHMSAEAVSAAIDQIEKEIAAAKDFDEVAQLALRLSDLYEQSGLPEAAEKSGRAIFLAAKSLIQAGRMARSVAVMNLLRGRPNYEPQWEMLKRWATEAFSKTSLKSQKSSADDHMPPPTPYKEMRAFVAFESDVEGEDFSREQLKVKQSRDGLFSELSAKEFHAMLELATVRDLPAGTALFKEGDEANAFYIVADGEMDLESSLGTRKVFREGQCFGELALFSKTQRTATLFTERGAKLLEFSMENLDTVFMLIPQIKEKIFSFYELRLFFEAAARNKVFQRFSQSELEEIADYLTPIHVPEGRELMVAGEDARSFFVIAKGHCNVVKHRDTICTLGPGHFIGEIGIILNKPRNATVVTVTEAFLLECQRDDFEELLRDYPKFKQILEEVARLRDVDHSDDPTHPGFRLDPSFWTTRLID